MIDFSERLKKLQGLLNSPMNQSGGLLDKIPQGALLGSAIYGQGIQGKDPFASLLPAALQTAQLQKYMTPKASTTKAVYNSKTGKTEFATEREIAANPNLSPAPTGTVTRFNTETGQVEILPAGMAGQQIKDQTTARSIGTQYGILEDFIGDMKNRLPETKTGAVGIGYSVVENLADQTSQLAESLGVKDTLKIENTEALDNYLKSKGFTKAAQNYATMKGSVTNVGYALAKIAEPDNPRLSEGDIIRQLDRLNFGGSREVFAASLDQILKEEGIRAKAEMQSLGGDMSIFDPQKNNKKKEKEQGDILDLGF
jgi:hypothetical protein